MARSNWGNNRTTLADLTRHVEAAGGKVQVNPVGSRVNVAVLMEDSVIVRAEAPDVDRAADRCAEMLAGRLSNGVTIQAWVDGMFEMVGRGTTA